MPDLDEMMVDANRAHGLDYVIRRGVQAIENDHLQTVRFLSATIHKMGNALEAQNPELALEIYREHTAD